MGGELFCSCGLEAEPDPVDPEPYTMSCVGFGATGTEGLVTFRKVICPGHGRVQVEVDAMYFPPEDVAGMEAGALDE